VPVSSSNQRATRSSQELQGGNAPITDDQDRGVTGQTDDVEDRRVAVVVMSRNRRDELISTLSRHRAPVTLIDNASVDGTVEAVRERFPVVDVLALPANVGAFARTIGARRVDAEFVAFADDDSWWAPGALTAAADILAAHPDIAVVNARILVGPEHRLDGACEVMARSPLPRPVGAPWPSLLGFVACGAMVRRGPFLAVGGFDHVVRFPGEEERVALDLVADGWRIVYAENVVVNHHPSPRRHSTDSRVTAIQRASVLTAVLRLSWPRVVRRMRAAAASGPAGRRGLLHALRDSPAAVRRRRAAPEPVQVILDRLTVPTKRARPAAIRRWRGGWSQRRWPPGSPPDP